MDLALVDELIGCATSPTGRDDYPQLPGWCTLEKGKRLARIVLETQPALCVELGVHGARSLISIALGLKLKGSGIVEGIDSYSCADSVEHEENPDVHQVYGATDFEALRESALAAIARFGVGHIARLRRSRSAEAAADYDDGSVDLIHLDANHSEIPSCADVDAWLPKVRTRAVWICDDTNWPSMTLALCKLRSAGFRLTESGPHDSWGVYRRERA
jgi:hypothetical protein